MHNTKITFCRLVLGCVLALGLFGSNITAGDAYAIQAATSTTVPLDATTYFGGCLPSVALGTTSNEARCFLPAGGTITRVFGIFRSANAAATPETSTVSLRLNDATDTVLSTTVTNNAIIFSFDAQALSIPVAAGDTFELKWVTPTWATNPTGVRVSAVVYVK